MPPRQYYREMISLRSAATLAFLGVLIFFIGMIIGGLVTFLEYDSNYYDTYRMMTGVGRLLSLIGILTIAIPLYVTGISNERLDWKVRATMLSTATALVIATMVISMFMFMSLPTYIGY